MRVIFTSPRARPRACVPAMVSQTAGTFVCNHVFYTLLHTLRRQPGVAAGFLHVPLAEAPAAGQDPSRPWVPLALQRAGLQAMLRVLMLGEGPISPTMPGEGRLH